MNTSDYGYEILHETESLVIQKKHTITIEYLVSVSIIVLILLFGVASNLVFWIALSILVILIPFFFLLSAKTPERGIVSNNRIEIWFPRILKRQRRITFSISDIKEIRISKPMYRGRWWKKTYRPQIQIVPIKGRAILFFLGNTTLFDEANTILSDISHDIASRMPREVIIMET